ncbi:hypothetical protein BCR34DRAFT_570179 [Clohesyomyces aquaticus]|uniref:Homeodomain-like protein n=1 Tax=Clohesyomyces aquaticus TaxID=1231657 RepID=A0A1Y1ZCY8_9PLEO|nr:hypothetical protein BCR34DRAFT_570179 [Clohesyomyces aquaticus]
MSNERPSTPERPLLSKIPNTWRRARFFAECDIKRDGDTMGQICERSGISRRTGERWRQERRLIGTPIAIHRVRKLKSERKGTQLRRPFTVPEDTLRDIVSPEKNPHQWAPLVIQARKFKLPIKKRTLQFNLKTQLKRARMYVAHQRKTIRMNNQGDRVQYGEDNKDKLVRGY